MTTFSNIKFSVMFSWKSKREHMTSLKRGWPAFYPVIACKINVQYHLLKKIVIVPDGFKKEFYQTFFHLIEKDLLNSFLKGSLSVSQKKGNNNTYPKS